MIFGITLQKLLLVNFWFTSDVPLLSRGFLISMTSILLAIFVAGLVLKILSQEGARALLARRIFTKWYGFLASFSVLGLLVLFFRQYNVAVLGARFWFLLLGVFAIIRIWTLIEYTKRQKNLLGEQQKKESFKRYLA